MLVATNFLRTSKGNHKKIQNFQSTFISFMLLATVFVFVVLSIKIFLRLPLPTLLFLYILLSLIMCRDFSVAAKINRDNKQEICKK